MRTLLFLYCTLVLIGCGSNASKVANISIAMSKINPPTSFSLHFDPASEFFPLLASRALSVGAASPSDLTSLKYYIRNIQLCTSLTPTATGFTNPQGCYTLYLAFDNPKYSYDPNSNYTSLADVARTDPIDYLDFMNDRLRTILNKNIALTDEAVRQYNWAFIAWYPPVKLNASIAINGGATYYTQDGTTTQALIGGGGSYYKTTATSDLTTNPQTEAVINYGSAGTWFRLQNPFSISSQDISSANTFTLHLIFNPDGMIKGFAPGAATRYPVLSDSSGRGMDVPLLNLSPVLHKAADTVTRQHYTASVVSGADQFDLRLDLFYITGDTNNTIYGVDISTIYTASTSTDVSEFPKVGAVSTANDGSLSFLAYDQSTTLITGFTPLSSAGGTTPATLTCQTNGILIDSCANGGTVALNFTLQSIDTIQ